MKTWTGTILIAMLLALSGCIVSLHPLYMEEDVIFEPALRDVASAPVRGTEHL